MRKGVSNYILFFAILIILLLAVLAIFAFGLQNSVTKEIFGALTK